MISFFNPDDFFVDLPENLEVDKYTIYFTQLNNWFGFITCTKLGKSSNYIIFKLLNN